MKIDEEKIESLKGGFQPKHSDFGFQPGTTNIIEIIRGFQPASVALQAEGSRPPSGGSNVVSPQKAGNEPTE
jgi:hypothetical protein